MAKSDSTGAVYRIDTKTGRGLLPVRREPYWYKLGMRQHVGFRKAADGGTWIARLTLPKTGERKYEALGDDNLDFDAAAKAARAWFEQVANDAATGAVRTYTLQDAIGDYVSHLRVSNSARAADQVNGRLTRHLPADLLRTPVCELTTVKLKRWRDSMVATKPDPKTGLVDAERVRKQKSSANRRLNNFKAALNLAWRSGLVTDDAPWRRLSGFKKADAARDLYLTEDQVAALLAAAKGGVRDMIRAGVLTGARRGELFAARVRDFNAKEGTLRVDGKTGARHVYLSDAAVAFFKRLAKGKSAADHLLTKDDGTPWPEDDLNRPFKAAAAAAGLPPEATFYSLRHYHISRALLAGVQPQVIAENCGTSLRMLEQHYGKFFRTDRRAMMNGVAL